MKEHINILTPSSLQSLTDYKTMSLFVVVLCLFAVVCISLLTYYISSYSGSGPLALSRYPEGLVTNLSMILISQLHITFWVRLGEPGLANQIGPAPARPCRVRLRETAVQRERRSKRWREGREKERRGKRTRRKKLNKLSGCNNVLPPDKLLAKPNHAHPSCP